MLTSNPRRDDASSLLRQRNLFAAAAVFASAFIAIAGPRWLRDYRQIRAVNSRLEEVQQAIVDRQQETREVQARIIETQAQIRRELSR